MPASGIRIGKGTAAVVAAIAATLPCAAQQFALPRPQFAPPNLTPQGVAGLAMNCAICHGPAGRPAAGSNIPALAGRRERDILEAMLQFKEGSRAATVMSQVARGYSEEEIVALARYFARLPAKAAR